MPDAVQTFVNTKRMDDVLQIQRDIVRSYEDDMVKYADRKDKAVIRECFQSIPKQLSKENKKFQYSVVKKGATASRFAGSCNGSRMQALLPVATTFPSRNFRWTEMQTRMFSRFT